jgi:hypothetical protein
MRFYEMQITIDSSKPEFVGLETLLLFTTFQMSIGVSHLIPASCYQRRYAQDTKTLFKGIFKSFYWCYRYFLIIGYYNNDL